MNISFDKEAQNTRTKKTTSSTYVSGQAEWLRIIECKWNNFYHASIILKSEWIKDNNIHPDTRNLIRRNVG